MLFGWTTIVAWYTFKFLNLPDSGLIARLFGPVSIPIKVAGQLKSPLLLPNKSDGTKFGQ